MIDINVFGSPTNPLLFDWDELSSDSGGELVVKLIDNPQAVLTHPSSKHRGPIDVTQAPDFSNFIEICRKQQIESVEEKKL